MMLFLSAAIRPSSQPRASWAISASSSAPCSSTPSTSSRVNGVASWSASAVGRPATSPWYRAKTAARRWSERRIASTRQPLGARDVVAAAGVDPNPVALVDEQRHVHPHAGLQDGGLRAPTGGGVALDAGLGVGDGHLDG